MVKNGVPGTPVGGSLHAWGVSVLSCWPTTLVGSSIDTFNETPGPFGLYQGRGGPAQRNGINTVSNPGYAGQAGVVLLQEYYA
jgi:hypothetical protein